MANLNNLLTINLENANEKTQEETYAVLVETKVNELPKRSLRKILELSLNCLKFKGEQVILLQDQLERKSDIGAEESGNEAYLEEIDQLKTLINKLESEKQSSKIKLKEMTENIIILQNRIHDMSVNESDKDSNDPLSELDKHEELLKKISAKNKHIKRLIRDIEALQMQNIEQSQTIIEVEKRAQILLTEKSEFQSQLSLNENEKSQLKDHINELTSEISRLESNITYLEEEREKADIELKDFIEKLEERARAWKKLIDEKEKQLESLKTKYEILRTENSKKTNQVDEHDIEKLVEAVQERDVLIEELETKIKTMAEEMIASTKLMNEISEEREVEKLKDNKKNRACCKTVQDSLNLLQERYKELSEMMEKVEEDNIFKSKQAAAVLKSLEELQNGNDVLGNSLRKVTNLERKLGSRDKQIKALIMEINSLHEMSQENTVLRKKLNISEDEVVLTSNLVAKQRNKDKMLERLTLKFRASEEMRLQLKLDKMELKKEIIDLQRKLTDDGNLNDRTINKHTFENKHDFDPARNEIYCDNCLKNIQSIPNQDNVIKDVIKEWEEKYSDVIEENENLRVGMHEILEKIRDYDASSDHITIDCSILEKVLHALDARSISGWYHPAMRMQNELIAVKEREHALKKKIHFVEKSAKSQENPKILNKSRSKFSSSKKQSSSEDRMMVDSERNENNENSEVGEEEVSPLENLPKVLIGEEEQGEERENNLNGSNTVKPTDLVTMFVERSFEQETYRNELSKLMEKNRDLQIETDNLKIYKIQFYELVNESKKSETEIVNYCSSLVERLTDLELKFTKQNKMYEFLKEDFDKSLSDFKFSENINISLVADLKKQINNKKHEINLIKLVENRRKSSYVSKDEILILKKKYSKIENELSTLISIIFKENENKDLLNEIAANFGIIKDDMQLDFLTSDEYDNMRNISKTLEEDNNDLKIKCEQLEDLVTIAQEQVTSQQKLISEITDNHIDLRHLVADLQSSSEEKFLITKANRELDLAKKECSKLRSEKEILMKEIQNDKQKYEKLLAEMEFNGKEIGKKNANNDLKIEFLKKFVFSLQEKYCKYTPLIYLTDFALIYANLLKRSKEDGTTIDQNYFKKIDELISNKIQNIENLSESADIVKLVQYEIKCSFLEDQLKLNKKKLETTEKELNANQIAAIEGNEQWKTIEALFGEKKEIRDTKNIAVQTHSKELIDASVNTDQLEQIIIAEKAVEKIVSVQSPKKADFETQVPTPTLRRSLERQDTITIEPAPRKQSSFDKDKINEEITSLENQLQQAKSLASKRSALLLESENKLAEANGRIKEMEKIIEEQRRNVRVENFNAEKKTSGIIETTMTSLQSLLSEKDTTLSHYQELLKTEREQHLKSCETYEKEICGLKKTQTENENTIQIKSQEILELKNQIENTNRRNSLRNNSNNGTEKILRNDEFDQNCDNSLNEISDEKIEEMFLDESKNLTPPATAHHHLYLNLPTSDESSIKHIHQLQLQIRELKNRELIWENSVRAKEEEIFLLKEKLNLLQEREKPDISGNAEIDQLKVLLEEKDKHISDLMETLTSFHDDQQRFFSETSLYSADQMTQLGANLNRCEATNKILQTQLDALKKQLTTLSQREKQSRDLANSLRNQLIKRPVLSIKSEINSKTKSEQQQKRIQTLETELEAAKREIQQQQHIIDTKRAKNAIEVSMWEKQKRHQQNAEKLKLKLEETEKSLEKTRSLLNAARTTINRLERDRNALQAASFKGSRTAPTPHPDGITIHKCCQNPSCPNFQMVKIGHHFDSLNNVTNCQSECSTERLREYSISSEYVDELKSKIETQQRRIHALELSSKGSNTLISEVEKLQEKISVLQAQNIRWEAKNLQLQLDLDLIRQGDENDRNKKRIKYLEDYIMALKEELAQVEAHKEYVQSDKDRKQPMTQVEQTILALKRIIERLKIENKTLKEGRVSHYSCRNDKDISAVELSKLKHSYAEAMNKISALQVELQLKTNCRDSSNNVAAGDGDFMRELKYVKEQLIKKTQLLEKAKILLTRAAAKEKSLKDQLAMWKRKCSELQNVPVIEEISE